MGSIIELSLITFSFNVLRDNYVLDIGDNITLLNQRAAFPMAMRDLICTVSPLFLAILISHFDFQNFIFIIISIQIFLYIIAISIEKNWFYHVR